MKDIYLTTSGSCLVWAGLAVLMILNGIIRQAWYGGLTDELTAHQISTLTGSLLSFLFVWSVTVKWSFRTELHALSTGLLWLFMTVVFEFGFGRFVAGHTWNKLLHDYDLTAGRVWALFLAWIVIMPVVIYRMRR